jgi:hypothetical protein
VTLSFLFRRRRRASSSSRCFFETSSIPTSIAPGTASSTTEEAVAGEAHLPKAPRPCPFLSPPPPPPFPPLLLLHQLCLRAEFRESIAHQADNLIKAGGPKVDVIKFVRRELRKVAVDREQHRCDAAADELPLVT